MWLIRKLLSFLVTIGIIFVMSVLLIPMFGIVFGTLKKLWS